MSEVVNPQSDNAEVRHERSDVNVRGIVITAGLLVVVAAAIHLAAWGLFAYLDAREKKAKVSPFPLASEERGQLPPEPRLEGIERLREIDVRPPVPELNEYEWVDQKAGIVQIPLDRAMKILIEQNRLPAQPEANNRPERGGALPSRANSGRTPEEDRETRRQGEKEKKR